MSMSRPFVLDKESEDVYEKILKRIECNTCGEYCAGIRQCQFGHAVCAFCVGKGFCRTCLRSYTNQRVLVIDGIHSMLTFPCRFRNDGCNFRGKYKDLRDHSSDCQFRVSFCPKIYCNWKGNSEEIFEHFAKDHIADRDVQIKPNVIRFRERNERRFLIKDFGVIFMVVFVLTEYYNAVSCYAVNFDFAYKFIENFEVHYKCTLMNGRKWEDKIACFSRTNEKFTWVEPKTGSLIAERSEIIFQIKRNL